jgi:predicted amidohydrolase YtcJ
VLKPYRGHDHETGLSFNSPDDLAWYAALLACEGFDLHIHAVGDRAVREALDALEKLPRDPDARHQIAHIDLIDGQDVTQLGALGLIANVSPLWAREDKVLVETKLPYLTDKQARSHFAFAALRPAGGRVGIRVGLAGIKP